MIGTAYDSSSSSSVQRKLKEKYRKKFRSLQNMMNPDDVINVLGPQVSEFGHKDKYLLYSHFLQSYYNFTQAIPEGQRRKPFSIKDFISPRNDQFSQLVPMIKLTL